jgi:hypothetical protein
MCVVNEWRLIPQLKNASSYIPNDARRNSQTLATCLIYTLQRMVIWDSVAQVCIGDLSVGDWSIEKGVGESSWSDVV